MKQHLFKFSFLTMLLFGTSFGWAQESPAWEVGVLTGRLLPDQVDGVTEVMTLTGGHLAFRLNPMLYAQTNLLAGKGMGQSYKVGNLALRFDQPLEDFLVSVYSGVQSVLSSGPGSRENNEWGIMVGGAFWFATGGPTWMKMDMNFGFGPGTTLFISLALVARF